MQTLKRLAPLILAALGGAALGLWTHGADAASYMGRSRVLFLGGAGVALGVAGAWIVRAKSGKRRWAGLGIALVAARFLFLPALGAALLLSGWAEAIARVAGVGNRSLVAHMTLGFCFVGFLTPGILLTQYAFLHLKRGVSVVLAVLFVGLTGVSVIHPEDRVLSPLPFSGNGPPALH